MLTGIRLFRKSGSRHCIETKLWSIKLNGHYSYSEGFCSYDYTYYRVLYRRGAGGALGSPPPPARISLNLGNYESLGSYFFQKYSAGGGHAPRPPLQGLLYTLSVSHALVWYPKNVSPLQQTILSETLNTHTLLTVGSHSD